EAELEAEAPQPQAPAEQPDEQPEAEQAADQSEGEKTAEKPEAESDEDDGSKARRRLPWRRKAKKAKKDEEAKDDKPSFKEPEDFYEVSIKDFPLGARMLLGASVGVCAGLSKVLWHWRLEGGKTLWKADGGRMVVMNHVSMLDPVVIVVSDWAHGRRMRPIYKSEFDSNKFVSWFFARIGAIPVTRGTADIKAVRRAQRALQRGEDVLVFPEGTRIKSEDQEVEIHGGFALMAQLAKVPVIPIAIVGARDGAPGGNKPIKPGRVYMRVGEPITFEELGVKGRKQQAKEMERVAMERVYELRDELRAEHPGKM
ncbi:MAG: 1-acyl-sn-glycerol-3-phosphate acyltransferase, partial [Coriobacteriales bacterium]|nr:1-acyl-sn-glycerol-3-phosphate acyltransferase [Coriobacteriales bacterium]